MVLDDETTAYLKSGELVCAGDEYIINLKNRGDKLSLDEAYKLNKGKIKPMHPQDRNKSPKELKR